MNDIPGKDFFQQSGIPPEQKPAVAVDIHSFSLYLLFM
jgi:hypothetical protein